MPYHSSPPSRRADIRGFDSSAVAGYLVATVVLSTLFGGFFSTYQVAFYEDLVERTEGSGGEPSVADEPTTPGDDAFVGGDR